MIKWITSFLKGRTQKIVLGETCSNWRDMISGVGSVLGLLLFVIYINDMLEIIKNECEAYADNKKIIFVIKSFNLNS